uniref:Androgen-induced gene 1 protein n=1 Tax=Varanus komodoensis TaxID=61221 RepID=A0A8D2J0N9_VARKO
IKYLLYFYPDFQMINVVVFSYYFPKQLRSMKDTGPATSLPTKMMRYYGRGVEGGKAEVTVFKFVAVAFWGLYAYDRELIYPAELDAINPSWLNHSMHTTILPLLVVELVICAHKYPPSILSNLWFLTIIFIFVYRIFWVHHVGGIWAYPILGVLGPCEKAIFLICAVCVMITFYFLGEQLTKWLWGK